MNKNSYPMHLRVRKGEKMPCMPFLREVPIEMHVGNLALDASIQKRRFHMQWLEGAQERTPESGIPQKAACKGPGDGEPLCLVPALSLQGNSLFWDYPWQVRSPCIFFPNSFPRKH